MFLLKPVNVALRVTEELLRLGVTELGSYDVIIGIVELLAGSILVKPDYLCTKEMSHNLNWVFLATT